MNLSTARERLRTGLWFVPAVGVVAGGSLAQALLAVDRRVEVAKWLVFGGGPGSARIFVRALDGVGGALRRCVVLGTERTSREDAGFGFRQLVDIAERALSPGVNDPTTAVQAIDRIHQLLVLLGSRAFPSPTRRDDAGMVRLHLPRPDWNDFVGDALDQVILSGTRSSQVVTRLQEVLEELEERVPETRRSVVISRRALLSDTSTARPGGGRTSRRARAPAP